MITPKDFKTVFGRFNSKFAGYAQHDSCEALGALMDNLHEDLNRIKKKPVVEPVEDEDQKDSAFLARASWDGFKLRNDSIVVDKFFGQDKSELWCPNCMKDGKSRRKFDPRLTVLVSLPTVNTKYQEIILVRRGCGKIMKFGLTIPKKGGSGQDMAESLSKLCGIPSTSLIILEAYSHKVYKTYVVFIFYCVTWFFIIVSLPREKKDQSPFRISTQVLHRGFIDTVDQHFGSRHHHRLRDVTTTTTTTTRFKGREGGR